mgnify:CR=1 FL=1
MSNTEILKPTLVTGAIRSGTTWVGRTICKSDAFYMIHEPFNPKHRILSRGVLPIMMGKWFAYISESNEGMYYAPMKRMVHGRYDWKADLIHQPTWKNARKVAANVRRFYRYRANNVKPLIKDPLAVLSAEWLWKRFDVNVIVLVRHPAAVVSSMKRLGWGFDPVANFLEQPALMKDHLDPFRDECEAYRTRSFDIIDQACLLWKAVNHVVKQYRDAHDNWLCLRHEDISDDPVGTFSRLYSKLGVDFTSDIAESIKEETGAKNPAEIEVVKKKILTTSSWSVNSRENKYNWMKRLTTEEIERIRKNVCEVSDFFYDDADWTIN